MAATVQPGTEAQLPIRQKPALPVRIASLDALRGLVMTLMLAEVLHLPGLVKMFPDSAWAGLVAFHTSHVEWQGASLHDLIQPGFSFLVGAALPFSLAARLARGQSVTRMFGHAFLRAFLLIALGIFLRSLGKPQTNFTFEDTLTQIGLGYVFLFALGLASRRVQIAALAGLLIGYWAFFALHPAPSPGFDYQRGGVPADWPHHYQEFAAHWNKNSNAAWAFDVWFMNLFPREAPFVANRGGYCTLSFIPTLATMILGLLTGAWLKQMPEPARALRGLVLGGCALIGAALLWQATGAGPIVKRIWTPSFTLYSGGLVILILAGFYALIEWKTWTKWAFPFTVVGMNSIAAYLMSWTLETPFLDALNRHLGKAFFAGFGPWEQFVRGAFVLVLFWLMLFWMYRRKIFLRI